MTDQRDGGIGWTDETWNPTRGCSPASDGCKHCYAELMAARFSQPGRWGHGFAELVPRKTKKGLTVLRPKWTGKVALIPDKLGLPLRWDRPRHIFVDSMSDLFHDRLTNEEIAAVFGVMAASQQHTFQVLTKRASRMLRWFHRLAQQQNDDGTWPLHVDLLHHHALAYLDLPRSPTFDWPLPNVWLGCSLEDMRVQARAPMLCRTPAALRFLSIEPILGRVNVRAWLGASAGSEESSRDSRYQTAVGSNPDGGGGDVAERRRARNDQPRGRIGWVIVGGESGPQARPTNVAWIEDVVRQCDEAQIPVFVKQLGARPYYDRIEYLEKDGAPWSCRMSFHEGHYWLKLKSPKGDDPSEWPPELRRQEMPWQPERA